MSHYSNYKPIKAGTIIINLQKRESEGLRNLPESTKIKGNGATIQKLIQSPYFFHCVNKITFRFINYEEKHISLTKK